jgi:hypothetical protein
MGKVLKSLIPVIGGAIATVVTGGLLGPVLAGVLSATFSAIATTLISAGVGLLVSFGLSSALHLNKNRRAPVSAVDQQQLIRSSTQPRQVIYGTQRVGGTIVYAASSGDYQEYLHLVIAIAAHRCEAITDVWFDDSHIAGYDINSDGTLSSGYYMNIARIKRHLGDQTEADADLIAESPDGWSSAHKLLGITYLYVRLKYSSAAYQGIPNITCLVKGKNDIFDPRSGGTGYTENWALIVLDYLRAEFGLQCSDDEIDSGTFIAAANLSDEGVAISSFGATQARYALSGTFTLDQAPIQVMDAMIQGGAGALVYVQGQYRLYGGAYASPTASLGLSDFAGEIQVTTQPPRAQMFNSVRGTCINPGYNWIMSDYPSVQNGTYVSADGAQLWRQIDHPWINDMTRAQRLSKQMLDRSRHGITVKAPLRYASLTICAWDVVALTVPDLGWSAKPFRLTSWEFNPSEGSIVVSMQEEQPSAYTWYYDVASALPDSPTTTLVSPLSLPAPSSLSLTSTATINADGSVVPALLVSWSEATNPFVNADEVQWRAGSGDSWKSIQVGAGVGHARIAPVIIGTSYDVRVRAVSGLVYGPWTGTGNITASADTIPPGAPTSAGVYGVPRGFALFWNNPTDPDFDHVEIWQSNTSSGPADYLQRLSASRVSLMEYAPFTHKYFWLRSVDTSGNQSGFVLVGDATVPQMVTTDLSSGAVSGIGAAIWHTNLTLSRPSSGWAHNVVVGISAVLSGDAQTSIRLKLPFKSASIASVVIDGGSTSGGAEGGGGGGL